MTVKTAMVKKSVNTPDHNGASQPLRSQSFQEIMSMKPDFWVRWGNSLFLIVMLLVGVACWFIEYPDLIKARAKIIYQSAPKPGTNLIDGKLDKLTVVVELAIPQASINQVAVGQKVLIHFTSGPTNKLRLLQGRIVFVSQLPTSVGYTARVELDGGFNTTDKERIQYQEALPVTAEIVTNNRRLLERIYDNIAR